MTGWDENGHAVPTGLPIDRHLGSGDLQDAENCGYAPAAVLREMGVDHAHGDPQIQYRDGRIVLLDGTVLERGGTLNCVWAVTGPPGLDHSGVAGERSDSQIASTPSGTPVPEPDPANPSAALTTGCVVVPDEAVEAAARADHAHGRLALTSDPDWDGLPEVDRNWYRAAASAYLAAAAPLIAAQALRSYADTEHFGPEPVIRQVNYGTGVEHDTDCIGCGASWIDEDGGCIERQALLRRADELERGAR